MVFYYNNVQVKAGDGKRTNFWKDKWCSNYCLKDEFPILYRLVMEKEETLRSMYVRRVDSGDWNFQFRRRLYEWEEREVCRLKVLLVSATDLCNDLEDNLVGWLKDLVYFLSPLSIKMKLTPLAPHLLLVSLSGTHLPLQRFNFSVGYPGKTESRQQSFFRKLE